MRRSPACSARYANAASMSTRPASRIGWQPGVAAAAEKPVRVGAAGGRQHADDVAVQVRRATLLATAGEGRSAARGSPQTTSNSAPGHERLHLGGGAAMRDAPAVHEGDLGAALGLVHVGRGDEHGLLGGCRSAMMRQNSRRESGSTPVVGSSSSSRSGSCMRVEASMSFCFMPPERNCAWRLGELGQAHRFEQRGWRACGAARRVRRGFARRTRGSRRRSGRGTSRSAATCSRCAASRAGARARPTRRRRRVARAGREHGGEHAHQGRLARAVRAEQPEDRARRARRGRRRRPRDVAEGRGRVRARRWRGCRRQTSR